MPYRLLLADDSVTIQRVIELTFADEDVEVTAVGDGQQAIDRITANPPDIILADVGMPARDGYEVAAFVKDRPELAHIPVLLLTGAFEPVDEARARAVRCNGVLAKPFEPQLLIGRVKELLTGGGSSAQGGDGAAARAESPHDDSDDTGPVPVAQVGSGDIGADTSLPGAGAQAPAAELSLDDYFDRLDAAFASLSGPQHGKDAAGREADTSWAPASSGAYAPDSVAQPAEASRVTAAADSSPAPAVAPAAERPAGSRAPAAPVAVADAFAALLEAERQGGELPVFSAEAGGAAVPAATPALTDAFLDEVAQRVAARLGEQAMRDMVAQVVSETAERLVREEIERLKATAGE